MNKNPSRADLENRIRQLEKENRHYQRLFLNGHGPVTPSLPVENQARDLGRSEEGYRLLFEHSNDAIIIHDLDGRILDSNSRAFEMLGYDREHLFQKTIRDIHADGEFETMEKAFQETMELGYTRFESKFKRVDGSIVAVEISSRIVDRNRGLVQGIIRDITARKRAEEELRRRESLFEKIFDVLPIGLWLADEKGQLLRGNPAGVKIWGEEPRVQQKEYGVFKARRLPSGEDIAPDDWALAHTINEGITVVDEMLEIDAFDGKTKVILNYTAPVLNDEDQIQGAIIVNQDITERVRAVEALGESEKNFRTLAENANDGIIIASREGRHIFANRASSNILGYTVSELLETKVADLIHPDELEIVLGRFKKRLMGRILLTNYETVMVRKDGRNVVLNMTASQVSWNGEPSVLVFFRDITEWKLAEKEKLRLESQLRQSHKMEAIGTLAGGIAHDFNNILGIILGNTELAMDDVPEWNPATEFLKEIRSASIRAKDVVRELLTFSRKSEERKKPLDLALLVKETIKMLRATIPTSISFELDIEKNLKNIHADNTQIIQVLLNLVSNAADAMSEEGGGLKITLENTTLAQNDLIFDADLTPGEYVKVKVHDTGSGIGQCDLDRIFDPYFTTKEIGKGTGMGLSVVHGIVKGHGGGIRVESEVGKGTLFEVFLPAVFLTPEVGPKPVGRLPRGQETILFVDDEESLVNLNRQRLEKLGYRVFPETNPLDALNLFRDDPDQFDLVITDMTMPHLTGDRLVVEILKIRPHIPVILCTGYSDRISKESAGAMGIWKYLEKPVEMEALARSVREVLDHS